MPRGRKRKLIPFTPKPWIHNSSSEDEPEFNPGDQLQAVILRRNPPTSQQQLHHGGMKIFFFFICPRLANSRRKIAKLRERVPDRTFQF